MIKRIHQFNLSSLLLATLLLTLFTISSVQLQAQRRILGSEQLEDEDIKDKKNMKAEKKAKEKDAAAAKMKAEKAAVAEKEAAKKNLEAEKLAKEKEKKKKEAEKLAKEKAAAELIAKEQKRLQKNRDLRIADSKIKRTIIRQVGNFRVQVTLIPGNVPLNQVEEVHFFFSKKQKVRNPIWGNQQPIKMQDLIVTMSTVEEHQENKKRKKKKKSVEKTSWKYKVHPIIGAKGTYAFHFTPAKKKAHLLNLSAKSQDGEQIVVSINLFPGIWPTPDWDSEEANNQKFEQ